MINFLHTFSPQAIIVNFGLLSLRWYGLFIVLGISAALLTILWLGKKYYQLKKDTIFDLTFWLVITGLIGARIYDVFLQFPYYLDHPLQIIQIWKGGLAIHGSIIAGLIVIYFFSKKIKINFFKITALIAPGLALGQAIGRWGNYFNQELFGLPTKLSWGIPIEITNRPLSYINEIYFHPTFLYESLGCFIIFLISIYLYSKAHKNKRPNPRFYVWLTAAYMILYSVLRFLLEFIRLDPSPEFLNLRWPQITSLIIILFSILILIFYSNDKKEKQ
jgi:phosphatidylglycerol---prolipoprotein diacylglyceryl transferase